MGGNEDDVGRNDEAIGGAEAAPSDNDEALREDEEVASAHEEESTVGHQSTSASHPKRGPRYAALSLTSDFHILPEKCVRSGDNSGYGSSGVTSRGASPGTNNNIRRARTVGAGRGGGVVAGVAVR